MNTQKLSETAQSMCNTIGKGLLAADESAGTCKKRFDSVGVECSEENRRAYRELLITAEGAKEYLSGIIFYDETLYQSSKNGENFIEVCKKEGILPGIKLDEGLQDLAGFPGEKISAGLDSLQKRLEKYAAMGLTFAKWRSVIAISDELPTETAVEANAYVLARYARLCQEYDIVPIVEPEILFDGNHTLEKCEAVTRDVYRALFAYMYEYKVYMEGAVLKTSMVLSGKDNGELNNTKVAERTAEVLKDEVPKELGGVVFLSGGQTPIDSFLNLSLIKQHGPFPWGVTFSYSRAIQDPVLKTWAKDIANAEKASEVYKKQLTVASKASKGELSREELMGMDHFVTGSQDL